MPVPARSICVYCGSRFGENPAFRTAADALGRAIAKQGWRLVYGAGDVGLMGAVASATMAEGGDTFGVIPTHLKVREVGKTDITTLVETETMHERKKVMFMNADAVVVLPGGAGSLDEFFEVLTWAQLGLHNKPIWLLNIAGYWDPLQALVAHVIDEGFADPSLAQFVNMADTVSGLIEGLDA
ncbi:MAG: TIGR00730 family Rossman fold protein [Pseudomonadota bacterium]